MIKIATTIKHNPAGIPKPINWVPQADILVLKRNIKPAAVITTMKNKMPTFLLIPFI